MTKLFNIKNHFANVKHMFATIILVPEGCTFRNAPMGTPVGSILWCCAHAYQRAIHRSGLTPVHTAEPNSALTLRLCTFRVP